MTMTPDEIEQFVTNLRKSLLDAHQEGHPITLHIKDDIEPVSDHDHYGLTPVDHRYEGVTFVIKLGRPAAEQMAENARERMGMRLEADKPKLPKLGDRATCESCGKPIEYVGPYWRHVEGSPRHIAQPRADRRKDGGTRADNAKLIPAAFPAP